jgi:hypothetical protein
VAGGKLVGHAVRAGASIGELNGEDEAPYTTLTCIDLLVGVRLRRALGVGVFWLFFGQFPCYRNLLINRRHAGVYDWAVCLHYLARDCLD